jgi:hypothetical protein
MSAKRVVYQFRRGLDGLPCLVRFVQKRRSPESVDSPRASNHCSRSDPLTRGVEDEPTILSIDCPFTDPNNGILSVSSP